MLRVIDVAEASAETIVVGQYVPLKVEWKELTPPAPAYWRPSADDRSLIEVGVHPETGRVCSITVVLPGGNVTLAEGTLPLPPRQREEGHPVCDVAPWGTEWMLDEAIPFNLRVDDRSASVWFGGAEEAAVDLVSGSVLFHLSAERTVVGFTVTNLPPEEAARLKDTLAWIRETAGRRMA